MKYAQAPVVFGFLFFATACPDLLCPEREEQFGGDCFAIYDSYNDDISRLARQYQSCERHEDCDEVTLAPSCTSTDIEDVCWVRPQISGWSIINKRFLKKLQQDAKRLDEKYCTAAESDCTVSGMRLELTIFCDEGTCAYCRRHSCDAGFEDAALP